METLPIFATHPSLDDTLQLMCPVSSNSHRIPSEENCPICSSLLNCRAYTFHPTAAPDDAFAGDHSWSPSEPSHLSKHPSEARVHGPVREEKKLFLCNQNKQSGQSERQRNEAVSSCCSHPRAAQGGLTFLFGNGYIVTIPMSVAVAPSPVGSRQNNLLHNDRPWFGNLSIGRM